MNQIQKLGLLLWVGVIAVSGNLKANKVISDSLIQMDSIGNIQYQSWVKSKDTMQFEHAKTAYISVFTSSLKYEKYVYALNKARIFYANRENAQDVKEWYVRAINAFNSRNPSLNIGLTPYQILEEKYALVLEFTQLYSKFYGKCEDAVEVLRVYKTEYSFKYIHYNRGLDQTDKIWLRLVKEDRYLSWDCVAK